MDINTDIVDPLRQAEPTKGAMSEERLPNLDQPIADFVDKQNFIYSSEEPESSLVQLDPKVIGGVVNGHDPVNGHEPDPGIVRSCTLFDSGSVPVDVSASTNPFAEHSSNPFSSNFEIPARDNACDNSDTVEKHEIGDFSVSSSSDMDRFNMDSESNYRDYDNSDNFNGNGVDVVQEFVLPKPNPNVLSFSDLQKRHEERHEASFEPSEISAFDTKFEAMSQSYDRHVEVVTHAAIDEPLLPEETIPRDLGLTEEAFQLSALNDLTFETAAEFPDDLNPLAKVQEPLASAPKSNEEDRLVLVQRPADEDENSEDGISRPESANQQEGEFAKLTELDQEISKIADSDCKGQQDLMNGSHLMNSEIKMPEEIDEYKQFADLHENEKTFESENPVKSDECFEAVMPTKQEEVISDSWGKEVEFEKSFGSNVVGFVDSIEKDSSLNAKSPKLEESVNDIPTHFEIEDDASQSIFEADHEKEGTTTNVVAEVHEEDYTVEAKLVPELPQDQASVEINNTVNALSGLINNTSSVTTGFKEESILSESVLNGVHASATGGVDTTSEELDICVASESTKLDIHDIFADVKSEITTEIKSDIDSVIVPTEEAIDYVKDEEIATEIRSGVDSVIVATEEAIDNVKDEKLATEIKNDIDSVIVTTEETIGYIKDEEIATEIGCDIDSVIVPTEETIGNVKDEMQFVNNAVQEILAVGSTFMADDEINNVDDVKYNSVEEVKTICDISGKTGQDEVKELVSAIDNVVEYARETTSNVPDILSETDNVVADVKENISDIQVKDIDIVTAVGKSIEFVGLDLVKVDNELSRTTLDAESAVTEITDKVDNEVKFEDSVLREHVDSVKEDVKISDSDLAKDLDNFVHSVEQQVDDVLTKTDNSVNEVEHTTERASDYGAEEEHIEDVLERRQESPVEFAEKQVESVKADSLFGAPVSGEFDLRASHADVAADPQAEGIPQFSQESFEELASSLKPSDSQIMPDVIENKQWRESLLDESAMLPADESYVDESTLLAEQSVVELNEPLGDLVAELNKLNLEGDNLEQKMIQDLEKLGITSQDTFQLENQDSEVTSTKDTPVPRENQQTLSTAPVEESVVQSPPPDVSLSNQLTEITGAAEAPKPELVSEASINQTEHAPAVQNVPEESVKELVKPVKKETVTGPISENVSEPIIEQIATERISEQISEPVTEQAVAEPIREQVSEPVTEQAVAEPIREQVSEPVAEQAAVEPSVEQVVEKSSAQPVEAMPAEQVSESIPEQKPIVEQGPEPICEQSHAQPVMDQVAVEPVNQQDSVVEQATGAATSGEVVIPSVIQELEAAAPLLSQEPETEHSEAPVVTEASSTVDTPAESEAKQEKPSVSSPVSESGATIGSEVTERVQPVAKVAPTQKGKPAVTVKGKPQTTKEASKKEAAKPNRPTNLAIKENKKPAPKPAQTKPLEKKPAATNKPVSTVSPTTKPAPKPAPIKKTPAAVKPSENEVKTNASKSVSEKPRTASTSKAPTAAAAKASPRVAPAVSPVKKTVITATAKVDAGAPAAKAAPGTARPLPRVALMSKPKPVENGAVNGPAVQKKPVAPRPTSAKPATKAAPKPATKSPPKPKQPTTPPGSPPKAAAEAPTATE